MLKAENKQEIISDTCDVNATKSVARYLYHLRTITIIRHIIPVIIASQQHRGSQLAFLEGDSLYQKKLSDLEAEMDHRLSTLKLLNRELSEPVPVWDIEQLLQEWQTVKDWSEGPLLENFNLHSHFIEQQMKLMWLLVEKSNSFFVGDIDDGYSGNNQTGSHRNTDSLLIRLILNETPELIELIARIRGLSTHALVIGTCDEDHYTWIEYLLRELNQKKEYFRELSKSLQKYVLRDFPALIELQMQDVRIVQLVQFIEKFVLRKNNIEMENQDVFVMATKIINSQTEVIYKGLDYIQNKMHRDFDGWHQPI